MCFASTHLGAEFLGRLHVLFETFTARRGWRPVAMVGASLGWSTVAEPRLKLMKFTGNQYPETTC